MFWLSYEGSFPAITAMKTFRYFTGVQSCSLLIVLSKDNFSYWMIDWVIISKASSPLDTGRKLNVHETFRRCPGLLLNVLCTFNLRIISRESRGKHSNRQGKKFKNLISGRIKYLSAPGRLFKFLQYMSLPVISCSQKRLMEFFWNFT